MKKTLLRTRVVLACLVGVLPVHALAAQRVPAPGSRVRIVGADQRAIAVGAFVRLAGDTVVLTDAAGSAKGLTLQDGRRLDISLGLRRRTFHGIGVGLAVGAGLGAMVGAATYQRSTCDPNCFAPDSRAFNAAAMAVVFSVPGMVIGGLVGSRNREWWEPVRW